MPLNRPCRRAMSTARAVAELRRHAGTRFDADLVERLLEVLAGDEPTRASAA